ncbi:MAG: endonuclease/exonuclease/phosphatase family protein, partial [Bacteroidota bacterium]
EEHPSEKKITQEFVQLLKDEQPDVVCVQEYYADYDIDMSAYPHQFIHYKEADYKLGHAIFSKYPLINTGGFDFEDSYNNTVYADAIVGSDTIRIYNLHLQSLGILPNVDFLQQRGTDKIKKRISETFVMQERQIETILEHKSRSRLPVILSGDFNNTSFSYAYRQLKKDMQDSFLEKGNGLGTTYSFVSYPLRIDFILASQSMDVLSFDTLESSFSDHHPVQATFGW